MIDIGPRTHHTAKAQIGLDQRGHLHHRRAAVDPGFGDQVHRGGMRGPRAHTQRFRRKMAVMQQRQRLGQRRHVRAVKRGDAEHDVDAMIGHVRGQPVPQVIHRRPAAIVDMHAGPAQFQQAPPRGLERGKVIFGLGIVSARRLRPVTLQHPVDPRNAGVRSIVKQDQVIKERVEPVPLDPFGMVDHRPATAQFRDEHLITQALRRPQVVRAARQGYAKFRLMGQGHRARCSAGRA